MKKKILKIILACLILIILVYIIFRSNKFKSFEDILFLKLFQNTISEQNNGDYYEFDVNCKNKKLEFIDLYSTTNANNLLKEKIAPGTSGEFSIGVRANKKSKYRINFISKNNKPRNLKFTAYENDIYLNQANSLEELSYKLYGTINKNEVKKIKIKWNWEYESEEAQDTEDSKIEKYEFGIYVEGEKIE